MTAADTRATDQTSSTQRSIGRVARTWAAATAAAALLVSATYLVALAAAGPLVVSGAGEVTLGDVIGFTAFGATIGAVLAVGIGRLSRMPRRTFLATTLIALAGYGVIPFTATESIDTAVWLNLLHLVVAIPVIGMLARRLPTDRAPAET